MSASDPSVVRDELIEGRSAAIETVRAWIALVVGDWRLDDPEAAVQEVTMKVVHLARAGRLRPEFDFRGFVRTVTRHACIDLYRRERLRSALEGPMPGREPAGEAGGPHEDLERRERRELLRFIYQALPEECRELWRWVYGEGLSASQVGDRLGITANNVRVRTHRCLARARAIRARFFPDECRAGDRP